MTQWRQVPWPLVTTLSHSESMTPLQRLTRMRKSFAKDCSILVEDYAYFTTPEPPTHPPTAPRQAQDASTPRSRAARTSGASSAKRDPK